MRLLQINLDLMGEKRGILLSIAIRWRETACTESRTVRADFLPQAREHHGGSAPRSTQADAVAWQELCHVKRP